MSEHDLSEDKSIEGREALAGQVDPLVMRWKPIETAPKDGQFLVYMPSDSRQPIQVAKWHPKMKVIGNHFDFDMEPPTHWMPLPEPPYNDGIQPAGNEL